MTRSVLFRIFIFVFICFATLAIVFGQTVPAPDGWTASQQGANWIYKANKLPASAIVTVTVEPRSEERRVGKECRSRWSPYH